MACFCHLDDLYDSPDDLDGLARLQGEMAPLQPGEINDSKETAPSKRLKSMIPSYTKAQHGPDVIELAGLEHVRSRCPRFHAWLNHLESLSSSVSS
jgi:hypothetical protein